ncbi:MAG: hypothetical protein ACJ75J_08210 [Cytophagaceae bacterium]
MARAAKVLDLKMNQNLKDNIELLINEGKEIQRIGISIMLSSKRNNFFQYLGNYIDFYNRLKAKLKVIYPKDSLEYEIIQRIPDLDFEDYSTNFLRGPSPLMSIFEWGYVKEVKAKIKKGLLEFELLFNKSNEAIN